jgi:diaminopimelate epimerase
MARPDRVGFEVRAAAPRLRFTKMHGAGNDFVVLDLRHGEAEPTPALCRALADRHTGVGCDQILTVESPRSAQAVAAYRIWNADGSASGQCGNGARCIAAWLVRAGAAPRAGFDIDSPAGTHRIALPGEGVFAVDMGRAEFRPDRVPLAGFAAQAARYTVELDGVRVQFGAVSMGNPHAVIEVDDADAAPVHRVGAALQAHAAFPDSANVGFAQVLAPDHVRLRVYERGVGETLACGSGACAAVAVLSAQGRVRGDTGVRVALPGGDLHIAYDPATGQVRMTGPAAFVFDGEWLA